MKKLLLAALLVFAPSIAAAQNADEAPPVTRHTDTRVKFWSIDTGVRSMFVKDGAYDPYSTNDVFTQWSAGFARTTYIHNQFSFAPGFRWDFGSSTASARGAEANVLAHRLTIPLELRMHVEPWFYVFTRAAPGALFQRARVYDPSLGEPMVDSRWVPAGDISVGASLLAINSNADPRSHAPRFWITPEVGYAWAGRSEPGLSPKTDESDPRQFGTLSMTGVALRGVFFRANITTTF